jgi:glycosyltransferase involved in cell wall biosynthesis
MPDRARLLRRRAVRGSVEAAMAAMATGRYVTRLAVRLRELRPDLVHTNSLKASLYGGLAARAARVPAVWHVHDRVAGDYLPPAAVQIVHQAARWLPTAVIANSETTRATLGPAAKAAVVIPPPVQEITLSGKGDGPLRIGVVGRLAPWKGQGVFLRAFADAFPGGETRAVLVGAPLFGEEDYELGLRALAENLGISSRVEFRGFREDVPAELARLDVLVHCSIVPEPFGQVVVEGMAAGLPVVAAAGGGPAEVVRDGVNGLLHPPGDIPALAAVLRRLAADESLRGQLGAAAAGSVWPFRADIVAEQVMDLYRKVRAGPSSARSYQVAS